MVAIVIFYKKHCRPNLQKLLDHYATLDSLTTAIDKAGLGKDDRGKRHPHQRRLTQHVLAEFTAQLLAREDELKKARKFSELHRIIHRIGTPIGGIGPLMVYDTALRIGANRRIYPSSIHLHAGARKGAKALGLATTENILSRKAFPKPLAGLKPHEIEDCLCIFKDRF